MNLVALVPGEDHVCCRYRIAAFQNALAGSGLKIKLQKLPESFLQRWGVYNTLAKYDAVLLQRTLLSWVEVKLLRRRSKRLIFDFDDAVWLRDSYSGKGFDDARRGRRFKNLIRHCDDVFAGNAYLLDAAKQANPQVRGHLIPTCVNHHKYPVAVHQAKPVVRLVWVGSASTLKGLEKFRTVLEQLGQQIPGVVLRLICDQFLTFQHLQTEHITWQEATEAQHISECDIGISWVPDDPWSRGKCGLKILQYQAAGLPVVTNPVGVHQQFVEGAGFLANSVEDWVRAVRLLSEDAALRGRLGEVARKRVSESFSIAKGADLWLQALRTR